MLMRNKQDLFSTWLDAGGDWDKVTMTVERTMQEKNRARSGWIATQGKVIKEQFKDNLEKATRLLNARKEAGLYYDDPDFPNDEDEARRKIWLSNIQFSFAFVQAPFRRRPYNPYLRSAGTTCARERSSLVTTRLAAK
jgi:hypothetical protein